MAFTDPHKNLSHVELPENGVVVDIGAGAGFYSMAAAELVPQGHVYAVDLQKDILLKLKEQARSRNIMNLDVIWGDAEKESGSHLEAEIADLVILSNVLFQSENKLALLKEAIRVLKPTGKLLVIDWQDSYGGLGPAPENIVTEAAARELLTDNKWHVMESFMAGDHHYGLLASKVPGV